MKYAIKNKRNIVKAYCLGQGSEMERLLMELDRIRLLSDGTYELMSLAAKNGVGQRAEEGDYFKVAEVDGVYYPYPNSRTFFLSNHVQVEDDTYEQKVIPLAIWQWGDESCDAIAYLLENGKLMLNHADKERFFNAFLWGAELSAAQDATVVFYKIIRGSSGEILDIDFNFVVKDVFERSYTLCQEK